MHISDHMESEYTKNSIHAQYCIQHATPRTAHTYQLQKAIPEMKLVEPFFLTDDPWIDKIRTGDDMA